MKTLGDLYDALKEIKQAEDEARKAGLAIARGGNEATMRAKHERLHDAHEWVARLRDRPLDPVDQFIADFF